MESNKLWKILHIMGQTWATILKIITEKNYVDAKWLSLLIEEICIFAAFSDTKYSTTKTELL